MRLCESDKQDIYIKCAKPNKNSIGAVITAFEDEVAQDRAVIQPLTSTYAIEAYGAKAREMLLMLYDGGRTINKGDGICVHVDGSATPDYKVVSEMWSGTVFDLEKI